MLKTIKRDTSENVFTSALYVDIYLS